MTSNRPYLIRALHQWILDNGMTPHLLVDATQAGVSVPRQYVDDGRIILNTSLNAINDLEMGNEWILFSARFSGVLFHIELPVNAVMAVYAKENGQGMVFPEEPQQEASSGNDAEAQVEQQTKEPDKKDSKKKSHLTVIK